MIERSLRLRNCWIALSVAITLLALVLSAAARVAATPVEQQPPEPDIAVRARELIEAALADGMTLAGDQGGFVAGEGDLVVRQVLAQDYVLTVCLDVAPAVLAADGWLGIERLNDKVAWAITPLDWRELKVQAWDDELQRCRSLSSFAPRAERILETSVTPQHDLTWIPGTSAPHNPGALHRESDAADAVSGGALSGKTVYISAGHGWIWTGFDWRTQRAVSQGFIEDHNNAEAVNQYLIRYLENAGATVIPTRERDRNSERTIVDNDAGQPSYVESGIWASSSVTGYAGSAYRYALTVNGPATAWATWRSDLVASGNYAVYVWYKPGDNRVPDAHYTVYHAGGETEVVLDQRVGPETWHYLGTFSFDTGPAMVKLDNRSDYEGPAAVIADAVRIGGGNFDTLDNLSLLAPAMTHYDETPPPSGPFKPWWEAATFYYGQWMGLSPGSYYNDVVARPIYARWHQRERPSDGVYISWHTNGYHGTTRGTESYVHNGDVYSRTQGSLELQAAVHDELIHDIRVGWDPAWVDRGKKEADLGEVRMLWDNDPAARVPGVLLELAFHDNVEDGYALKDPGFNRLSARAVYQGIVKYFEARDGVDLTLAPDPPTHLRVENAAPGTVRVAWSPPVVDAAGLGGESATAYHIYVSEDGLGWQAPVLVSGTAYTMTGLTAGETRYVRVTALNAGGESFPTEVGGARVGDAHLLIVQGFDRLNRFGLVEEADPVEGRNLRMWIDRMNNGDYVVHHGQAVPTELAWDSAGNEAVAAGFISLTDYAIVDWILGEESSVVDGSLNEVERRLLGDYLDHRGSLLISGSELAWDLEGAGRDAEFLHDRLRADYVADDADTYVVRPVPGGALEGLGDLVFDAGDAYDADYPDVLLPLTRGLSTLTYVDGAGAGGTAAIEVTEGCRRLLVFGFPVETLRPEQRGPVMAAAMDFLDGCGPTFAAIDTPRAGGYYATPPQFQGVAGGLDLESVEVQIERALDDYHWDETGWLTTTTWLPSSGTFTWSYALPPLAEGGYRLRARAVGTDTVTLPVEVPILIDVTPPRTPAVITPTGAIAVTGPQVVLRWLAPSDVGAPLHYEVAVDAVVYTTTVSSYTVGPGAGSHTWRVRAVDAAGNTGTWSAWSAFSVKLHQVFLPLGLRGTP